MVERRHVYAHTPNEAGEWHLLVDHLAGTAERAFAFAEPFGAGALARTAGWLHDAGQVLVRLLGILEHLRHPGH